MSSSENEEDDDAMRPPVYIRDPRNTVEYAQNVRNFKYAASGPVKRLGSIFKSQNIPSVEDMRAEWTALDEALVAKEASYASVVRVMPRMGPQLAAEIQTMRQRQLFLEIAVNAKELLFQADMFARTFHRDEDEERMCADCGSTKNITHQLGDDERVVYCKECTH